MDATISINIPTILEVDVDTPTPRSWSDVCGGNAHATGSGLIDGGDAVITLHSSPNYVIRTNKYPVKLQYATIAPRFVENLGTVQWSIKQTGTYAPFVPDGVDDVKRATVPFTKIINTKVIMPDYKCAQKAW